MKILLTLDYELFNGKECGTVENCLITPMGELLNVLDKFNFKATLFVDTVFINRLRELGQRYPTLLVDYHKIVDQLSFLYQEGHDLQLHIHPNWFNATYDNGRLQSVLTDYKISDMSEQEVSKMFSDGIMLLGQITGSNESIVAYRAGAYSVQSYSNYIELFRRYGIRIDSSVYRNQKSITGKWQVFDYTNIPKDYSYRFAEDLCKRDDSGSLIEVSIPTYHISKYSLLKYKSILNHTDKSLIRRWGDGKSSINTLDGKMIQLLRALKARFMPSEIVASIDSFNGVFLEYVFEKAVKKNDEYMLIMGHPKNFTPLSLICLERFLESINPSCHKFVTISHFLA